MEALGSSFTADFGGGGGLEGVGSIGGLLGLAGVTPPVPLTGPLSCVPLPIFSLIVGRVPGVGVGLLPGVVLVCDLETGSLSLTVFITGVTGGGGGGGMDGWALLCDSTVLLIRAHSNQKIRHRESGSHMCQILTFIEELFQPNSFPVDVSSWGIVGLRVVDHKPEISLEASTVFIEAIVELRTYGAQVHRVLDDSEVAGWTSANVSPQIGDPQPTLVPYHGQDPQVGGRVWHACAFAVSSGRFCKHPSRKPTFQKIEASARASSFPSPSPVSDALGQG